MAKSRSVSASMTDADIGALFGQGPWLAQTEFLLSRVLTERDHGGDAEEAAVVPKSSDTIAQKLGPTNASLISDCRRFGACTGAKARIESRHTIARGATDEQ